MSNFAERLAQYLNPDDEYELINTEKLNEAESTAKGALQIMQEKRDELAANFDPLAVEYDGVIETMKDALAALDDIRELNHEE